jgi:hypothetical protein
VPRKQLQAVDDSDCISTSAGKLQRQRQQGEALLNSHASHVSTAAGSAQHQQQQVGPGCSVKTGRARPQRLQQQ